MKDMIAGGICDICGGQFQSCVRTSCPNSLRYSFITTVADGVWVTETVWLFSLIRKRQMSHLGGEAFWQSFLYFSRVSFSGLGQVLLKSCV